MKMLLIKLLFISNLLSICKFDNTVGVDPNNVEVVEVAHPKHQPQNSEDIAVIETNPTINKKDDKESGSASNDKPIYELNVNHPHDEKQTEQMNDDPIGLENSFPVNDIERDQIKSVDAGSSNGDIVKAESSMEVKTLEASNTDTTRIVDDDKNVEIEDQKSGESVSPTTSSNNVVLEENIELNEEAVVDDTMEANAVNGPANEENLPSFKEFREKKEKEDKIEKETREDEKRREIKDDASKEKSKEKVKGKLIQKNYADNSCGAKIIDNKKEFKNSGTLLNSNKDLYAMIPCEGSIWFVVELCDTIQIHAIQLANYELFSSSVNEFKISVAEIYPPKEWLNIGTFSTVNKRELQRFEVDTDGQYSKFVKFEKITYRGKEHFCVLSTFEVLGMSMVDEYEEHQQPQVDIDPYDIPLDLTEDPIDNVKSGDKSIMDGARETVKNIVDSALNVLGVSKNEEPGNNKTETNGGAVDADKSQSDVDNDENVVVKVDELGKEIKEPVVPDLRLKGEVGSPGASDSIDIANVDKNVKPIVPKEPIMEGVNMSEESLSQTISIDDSAQLNNVALENDSSSKTKTEEIVNEKPVETKVETPEKDGKGVVMTNSPKKNSIFVELDKKIKDLEKDLSLSNDYLETLSNRYKRVDNLFKPLEKTLSTVDEAMTDFETRLKRLEEKFDKFESSIDAYLVHMDDIKAKSNTLITSTNLVLFLLMVMLFFFWRMSYKLQQISYSVFDKPIQKTTTLASYENNENGPTRKRQRSKQKTNGIRSRDPSPGVLVAHKSETNLAKRVSYAENKKPLESVQMDLIYPQPKSPTLKRRGKYAR